MVKREESGVVGAGNSFNNLEERPTVIVRYPAIACGEGYMSVEKESGRALPLTIWKNAPPSLFDTLQSESQSYLSSLMSFNLTSWDGSRVSLSVILPPGFVILGAWVDEQKMI